MSKEDWCNNDCYHYISMNGVYQEKPWCKIGRNIYKNSPCKEFVDRKDALAILKYKLKYEYEKLVEYSRLTTECNKHIRELQEEIEELEETRK